MLWMLLSCYRQGNENLEHLPPVNSQTPPPQKNRSCNAQALLDHSHLPVLEVSLTKALSAMLPADSLSRQNEARP